MLYPGGAHADGFIPVAFGLNFVWIWIVLLMALKLIEKLIARKRENA